MIIIKLFAITPLLMPHLALALSFHLSQAQQLSTQRLI